MYLKINGKSTKYYVSVMAFTTQHGEKAIRFIGDEVPETNKGFKYYNDDDSVLSDFSDYKYLYRPNEYSTELDVIVPGEGSDDPLPPSPLSRLSASVSRLSQNVSAITPYKETKFANFGEKEKVFYGVPGGNVSVFFDNYNGEYEIQRVEDRLTVAFAALEEATNITIIIQ